MSDAAFTVEDVLWEERKALACGRIDDPQPADIANINRRLNEDNRWALCLSGGGIRSAAFALGVIQRLAAQRLAHKVAAGEAESALQQFEYLSTVSGGGYIGSWLSAWLLQERKNRDDGSGGANKVVSDLNGRLDYREVGSITNLRRDSHYLAPSFSAISPDLWSGIAAVGRNLCLNWLLLVPPMILAVLVTKAASYGFIEALNTTEGDPPPWLWPIITTSAIGFVVALSFSVANRPARGLINASQAAFLIFDLAIFLASAALLIFVLGSTSGRAALTQIVNAVGVPLGNIGLEKAVLIRGPVLGLGIYFASWVATAVIHLASWIAAAVFRRKKPQLPSKVAVLHALGDLGCWCVAGAAFGALVGAGYLAADRPLFAPLVDDSLAAMPLATIAALVCTAGLPWIVSARIIADVIFISFAKFIPGADAGLEYQARSGGLLTLAQLGWFIWFGLVLGAPIAAERAEHQIYGNFGTWLAAVGGFSGAFAVIVGASSKTIAIVRNVSGLGKYLSLNTLAAIAAAIFAASLIVGLSILIDQVIDRAVALKLFSLVHGHAPVEFVEITGVVLGILILAASLVIGINQYSLHGIYRDRLVRAFLGASRDEKQRDASKNRFTDFDSYDSPLLHQLWPDEVNPRGDQWRPLHIINAAVNLVSSKELAWQERMAAPFTFSPLYCGSGSSMFGNGAYRRTHSSSHKIKSYGGREGLTLGTAMAISGAAVSPNMGYNTSPGVAFLMTLFNVRLGWWLANPRQDNYGLHSPRFALRPYFMEMFGLTSANENWIYLSDGGHFENLGIYEMVRRRCRVIVVSDAGCDPDYTFDDLGNALRKIRIDLGVHIEMDGLDRLKKRFKSRPTPAKPAPYWAIGRIRYKAADRGGEDGWLLYFKSGLHGTEPMDVLSYAMGHPTFPHESTANQFFSESQFESYRALGFEIVNRAFEAAVCPRLDPAAPVTDHPGAVGLTLEAVIKCLYAQSKP